MQKDPIHKALLKGFCAYKAEAGKGSAKVQPFRAWAVSSGPWVMSRRLEVGSSQGMFRDERFREGAITAAVSLPP